MATSITRIGMIAALCLGAAGTVQAQQAAPAASADTPQAVVVTGQKKASKWTRAESQHFVVISDAGNADVRELLNNLEKLDHILRIYTKEYNVSRGNEQKLTLYYHNRMGSFLELAEDEPPEAVGFYNSCAAGVQASAVHLAPLAPLADEALAKHSLNASLSYIFEAYTRHFLYRYTNIRSPAAYIDGFAHYFASVRFSDQQMVLGRAPTGVGRFMYFLDNGNDFKLTFKEVLAPESSKDPGTEPYSAKRLEFMARSWLLVHYMLSTPENHHRLDQFLNLVHQDVPAGKAFEDAFAIKLGDVNTALWRYRLKGLQVVQVDLPSLPAASVSFSGLPEAYTDFVLADAALKACPDKKTGEELLRTVTQRAGGVQQNDLTRLTVSRAQVEWGKPADALPFLTEAVRKDPNNHEALYLLGLANLRLARLQDARGYLLAARRANPRSAEAAYAAYRTELAAGTPLDKTTLEGAIAAWRNAHEVNLYARSAALALAYLGSSTQADSALTLLAHNGADPDMASWAKTWQKRLAGGVKREELVAEMRRETSPQPAFREWTLASEDLMKSTEFNANLDKAQGYFDTMRMSDPTKVESGASRMIAPRKR